VKAATRTSYKAILMDCQIPVLDGCEATIEIRRLEEGSRRRTPIIAVTATPLKSGQERCLAAGMDDYLAKPFSLKGLAAVLARWTPDRTLRTAAVDRAEPVPSTAPGRPDMADLVRPVLDAEIVGRLQRLGDTAGEDLMGQLATLFLADAHTRVLALRQALTEDDAVAVVRSAHMLSGASANLGATDLARLCATFATDGAAGELTNGGAQLAAVETELERVRAALNSRTPAQ
jgi:CheY-like chemotaxis protein